ncbi:unnamed protein product [Dracunculus medinensis]|uniref:Amino_oxidase domain-containing protein n=1 Tax=Dracunculus medinensis TaxID=318479 RepID=A0A0N4U882_DRAME|nr:unnamed protein product [Dracunculus medinensis]
MKIVVIGCAPTALGFAHRLHELQTFNDLAKDIELLVLEKESFPGGLSCSVKDEKGFLWDMGGHITFNHNFPYYERAVTSALPEWNKLKRNCQVDINYMFDEEGIHLVPYPAQFAIPLFPEKIKRKCLEDLMKRFDKNGDILSTEEASHSFDGWILKHFGPTILDNFFKLYTKKVWTVETTEMSSNWVGTRVAMLPMKKLEQLCAASEDELRNADFGWGPNAYFTFPKYGGTGAVWNAIANQLPSKWLKYNSEVIKIDTKRKKLTYEEKVGNRREENTIDYDILVNTGPIDQLVSSITSSIKLNLRFNKVCVIGVGLKQPMTSFLQQFTWLYFPDPSVPFFRVTIFSKYGEVTPDNNKFWSLMCECARPIDDETTESEFRKLTIDGLIKKSMIESDQIVSVYSIILPYGYPIPTVQRDSTLSRIHQFLEERNIYSRGRFGGWKYECSNQDHCFMQGKELIDRIIFDEPEKVYKTGVAMLRG